MATPAQVLANQANAQQSTGPRTAEGKAKSARNATTHGLTLGVLHVAAEDRAEWNVFEQALTEEMNPKGALELDAMREFRDAAWRLRQIRKCAIELFEKHNEDPFTNVEAQAALRQLTRYRAAAEMSLHRALNTFRDLQTTRLGRLIHLAKSENEAIGPLADSKVFAFMNIEGRQMNRVQREYFDEVHGVKNCV
jgi:hypothetical protein